MKRLVVLVSGHGSNLQVIMDACAAKELPASVVAVVSNRQEAYALERARLAAIPAIIKIKTAEQSREDYDRELADTVAGYAPDWVVLAGWMRILTSVFLKRFYGRVINLHPALPGAFPGLRAIERAFEAFQEKTITCTGVMVHEVLDEGVDNGRVLGQITVPIYTHDTLEELTNRVHLAEHQLLIRTLRACLASPSHSEI